MAEASAGTDRLARAPGGLGLVRDVVNTRYVGPAWPYDPFADLDRARPWLDERDLGRLRELRDTLAAVITDPSSAALPWQGPAVGTRFGADGVLRLEPQGAG